MITKKELLLKNVDHILLVNKDYEIVYNSRFDPAIGNKSDTKEYKNFFEMYPSLGRNNSSIVKTMSTGTSIFRDAQEFVDINGNIYVTQNVTIPIFREGQIVGTVELTKDLTTVGDATEKKEYLNKLSRESNFNPNMDNNEQISFDDILTIDEEMLDAIERAKIFAMNQNPTLIYGETGTGKEVFAQAMIDYSGVPKNNVVIQNCAAVPETLIESILFGTVKGVYTGAENHKGLFEIADGGIIFLDELNSIPFHVQAKLLRVLQDGTFRPLGSNKDKRVKVKVIAAMNIDPMTAIERNILRKDLFYRFSGGLITLSPLRERPEDIELFTRYYIKYFSDIYDKEPKDIDDKLMNAFMSYAWEGNVRELMNAIEFMVTSSQGENILTAQMLPVYLRERITAQFPGLRDGIPHKDDGSQGRKADFYLEHGSYHRLMDDFEKNMIEEALYQSGGNKSEAARLLGIPRQTLKYRMKILQIK